ncbi:MAG TPA: EAL domain-containing protein [Solirubrobacteraceae bacterium]|nr:EAL domain-containing protein [Solirubrobacteraceae bacterium]
MHGSIPDHGTTPATLSDVLAGLTAGRDATAIAEAVVRAAREHLGMEVAFLSEFVGDRQVYRVVDGHGRRFGTEPGESIALEDSYCARVVRGTLPNAIPDTRDDPLTSHLPPTADAGIGAYIGVPVRLADGRLYGTLCGCSHEPANVQDRDVGVMEALAAVIADVLSRDPHRHGERRRHAAQIARALDDGAVRMAFQPILRLHDGSVVGYEALARFDGQPPTRPPDEWFAAAWEIGVGTELELLAVRTAARALERLPGDAYVSVNADARTIMSAGFAGAVAGCDTRRLMIELTEHAPVREYEPLIAAMAALRRRGVRFAVDDAGAGYSGLNHMVRVAPDVIKLDRFLIAGVHEDPARRALTASAAVFAAETGTTVVAEGIETEAEMATLRAAGIDYGQGFHLGRPAALDVVAGSERRFRR